MRRRSPPSAHVLALQAEITQLRRTRGGQLEMLLRQFPDSRRLLENLSTLADRAEPLNAANIEVVARSRGHNLGDGIVALGDHVVTPGYAVGSRSDQGRLGAAVSALKRCANEVERLVDPSTPRPRDDRPRCGRRACEGRNVRQPVGIRVCGFCGLAMSGEEEMTG